MDIYSKTITTGKVILAVSILLTLTACKQNLTLSDANNVIVGNGTLEVSANSPSPVKISIDGKEFSGTWSATKVYEEDVAKRHRLISTRSYDAYMQGNTPDQLRHGRAVLAAQDGTELTCDFYYRGQPKAGECNIDGKELKLRLSD